MHWFDLPVQLAVDVPRQQDGTAGRSLTVRARQLTISCRASHRMAECLLRSIQGEGPWIGQTLSLRNSSALEPICANCDNRPVLEAFAYLEGKHTTRTRLWLRPRREEFYHRCRSRLPSCR